MTHKYDAFKSSNSQPTPAATTCAVVGARGYSGLELVRALLKHPYAQITEAYASKAFDLTQELEESGVENIAVAGEDQIASSKADVIFLATPADVSLQWVPKLLKQGKKVIDLSGAFRLQKNDIKTWYGFDVEPTMLAQAHYGLVPFAAPMSSAGKSFVSNPGCYATAIQMALIPLLKQGLIDPAMLVVDAKSGTSGAGRKAQEGQIFAEVAEDIRPYRIGRHQHLPEIQEGLETFGAGRPELFMSTHLLPVRHGIQAMMYAKANVESLAQIEAAYAEAFSQYPLVRFGRWDEKPQLANLTKVVGTPFTRISYELQDGKLYLVSCIDNRLKGAATQAIENLNVWMDWPVEAGLLSHPVKTGLSKKEV